MLILGIFVLWFLLTSGTIGVKLVSGFWAVNMIYCLYLSVFAVVGLIAIFITFLGLVLGDGDTKVKAFLLACGGSVVFVLLAIKTVAMYFLTAHLILNINQTACNFSDISGNNLMLMAVWFVVVVVSMIRGRNIAVSSDK